jgi:hypothetical protein
VWQHDVKQQALKIGGKRTTSPQDCSTKEILIFAEIF